MQGKVPPRALREALRSHKPCLQSLKSILIVLPARRGDSGAGVSGRELAAQMANAPINARNVIRDALLRPVALRRDNKLPVAIHPVLLLCGGLEAR